MHERQPHGGRPGLYVVQVIALPHCVSLSKSPDFSSL